MRSKTAFIVIAICVASLLGFGVLAQLPGKDKGEKPDVGAQSLERCCWAYEIDFGAKVTSDYDSSRNSRTLAPRWARARLWRLGGLAVTGGPDRMLSS